MMKLLLGGSLCTHWSHSTDKKRETEPEGLGWELFKNAGRSKLTEGGLLYHG